MKSAIALCKMPVASALVAFATLSFAIFVPVTAQAQFYKGKTITEIVNYPAGGPTDLEGRIVAQFLPAHIPGHPAVIVKDVGGAGGIVGSNELGAATPNGETIGFFTLDVVSQILGNSALKMPYSDFVFIAGVESPLVVYIRKDTPPGIQTPADLMKTTGFKALSLNAENSNTLNIDLALDLLGVKYEPIPAYRGLKEVETAILQNIGQAANTSLSGWAGSVEPTMGKEGIILPLYQLSPRKGDAYPRTKALPNMQTFEEFYASVHPDQPLKGQLKYQALRAVEDPQLAMFRTALVPPKTPDEAVSVLRAAFIEMWKDPEFLAAYSNIIKTEPVMVTAQEGQHVLAGLATVSDDVKNFVVKYIADMTAK
jgi:tripartite-type tricarboxylate transporter receptor subunit TctC